MNADVSSVLRLMFLSSPPHPSLQQVDNEISKHDLLFFPLLQSHHHPNSKKKVGELCKFCIVRSYPNI